MSDETRDPGPDEDGPRPDDLPGPQDATRPTFRERTRPVELVGLSGGLAVFTFLISWMASREPVLALIFGGVAFIIGLVVLAMLALAVAPEAAELAEIEARDDDSDGPAH